MIRVTWHILVIAVSVSIASNPAAAGDFSWIEYGVSGSQISFNTDGNIYLDGKCFGNVSSSFCSNRTMPTGEIVEWFNREAVAKDGNLFFAGTINLESGSLPSTGATWGSPIMASIQETGGKANLYVQHKCKNSGGCSNTVFEPARWNSSSTTCWDNNCYNYANDKITGTFAQPGRATGHLVPQRPTCNDVNTSATSDGLINVGAAFPGNNYDCGNGHLVFAAVGGDDYHWFRFDQITGRWSHKPGHTAAVDKDDGGQSEDWSGNPICNPTDPSTDRGQYTTACYYYCTCGGLANIR
jgi:hypothetical protein